jgi:PAS domain S-box-containing protein
MKNTKQNKPQIKTSADKGTPRLLPIPEIQSIFEAVPGLYLVLKPDPPKFTIVAVSDAYAQGTMVKREEILRKGLFEVFPDNPGDPDATGVTNLTASLLFVLEHKKPHKMEIQKYDIPHPEEGFEVRYWSPLNTPVLDANKNVTHIIHSVVDVTNTIKAQQKENAAEKRADAQEVLNIQLMQTHQELDESKKWYQALIEKSADVIALSDTQGNYSYVTPSIKQILGYTSEDFIKINGFQIMHLDETPYVTEKFKELLEKPGFSSTIELRCLHKDGTWRWIEATATNLLDDPNVCAIVSNFRDITEQKRIQSELEQAKGEAENERQRIHDLFMQAPAIIVVVSGPSHVFELANPMYLQLIDKKREDIIGKTLQEALPEVVEQGYLELLDTVYKTGEPFIGNELPTKFQRNGKTEEIFLNFIYQPYKDSEGKVQGIFAHAVDVTEQVHSRKKLEESEARLRFMAESMPQKVFTAKPNGDVDYFNPQWTEFTGLSFEEIKNWGWTQFIHPDDVEENIRRWQHSINTGESFEFEHRFRRNDGVYHWHVSRAVPMCDEKGNIIMWIGSNTDIDEQKKALAQKDEFLAVASHELKTPITSVKGFTEYLLRTAEKRHISPHEIKILKTVNQQVDRLTRLINDMLDVSRIATGKLFIEFGAVRLTELVEETVEQMNMVYNSRTFILHKSPSCIVVGNYDRIQQVLVNLLSNAVQHSTETKPIHISMKKSTDTVTISVCDMGIGIPKERQDKIFERFYQAQNQPARGLGLGLYISKEIIERHHGTIWFESEDGKGSTFSFSLPMKMEQL